MKGPREASLWACAFHRNVGWWMHPDLVEAFNLSNSPSGTGAPELPLRRVSAALRRERVRRS